MGLRQALLYFDDTVATPALTINIAPVALTGYHGFRVVQGVEASASGGYFTVIVPGVYLVLFNMSFTFTNGQPLEANVYVNGVVTPFGSHAWGLTSLRSNLSIMTMLSLNRNDKVSIALKANLNSQALTLYDSQFMVMSI